MNNKIAEYTFSVELNSKDQVRLVTLDNDRNKTMIEGVIGEIRELNIIEGILLEIKASAGTLRIDLPDDCLNKIRNLKKEVY